MVGSPGQPRPEGSDRARETVQGLPTEQGHFPVPGGDPDLSAVRENRTSTRHPDDRLVVSATDGAKEVLVLPQSRTAPRGDYRIHLRSVPRSPVEASDERRLNSRCSWDRQK